MSRSLATHSSEGEAGHNVLPEGEMRDTQKSQLISTQLRQIAVAKRFGIRTRCLSPWPTEWMWTFFMRPTVGCARMARQD